MNKFGVMGMGNRWVAGMAAALLVAGTIRVPGAGAAGTAGEVRELSLEQAVELALSGSPGAEGARLERERARLAVDRARQTTVPSETCPPGVPDCYAYQQGVAVAKQRRDASDASQAAAEAAFRRAGASLRLQVEEDYFQAWKAGEGERIAAANLERARQHLAQARLRYAAGDADRAEFLAAEAEVSRAEAGEKKALRGREQALLALKQVVGLPLEASLRLTTRFSEDVSLPSGAVPEVEAALDNALARRPDLIQARQAAEEARRAFGVAKSYYSENVFAYREALLNWQQADLAARQKEVAVAAEVRSARLAVDDAAEQLPLLRRARDRSREGLAVTALLYERGLASGREVADARAALMEAEQAVIAAVFDYQAAVARYRLASALD